MIVGWSIKSKAHLLDLFPATEIIYYKLAELAEFHLYNIL